MADAGRIGPYRLVRRLGVGGMGAVYLAWDDRLERRVALKRLHGGGDVLTERRERSRREAKIAARLNHSAIVQIYDVVRVDDDDWIVMEYVEGEDLRRRIQAGPPRLSEALAMALEIARGMAEAHDQGVIHRDLKCENVLVTRAGRVKITDFGIAELLGEDTRITGGAVVGTLRTMSPEQARGHPVDHRSDLFSFGVLLYELLTGVSPFQADSALLTLHRIMHASPRPVADLAPGIPPALVALVEQLLHKSPSLRPRDFHEVADALADIAGEAYRRSCCRDRPGGAGGGPAPPPAPGEADDTVTGGEPAPAPEPPSDREDREGMVAARALLEYTRRWQRVAVLIVAAMAAAGLAYALWCEHVQRACSHTAAPGPPAAHGASRTCPSACAWSR
jgi:serine/threonine protein kinase